MATSLEISLPSLEGLTLTQARSVIRSNILQFTTASPPPEHTRDIVVLVNLTRRSIIFLESISPEEGSLPASKDSVEAMPMVKVLDEGTDCTICLSDFKIGEEAKEMPCTHHFHSVCIDKWLGINGSCPICRYKMPVEKEGENKYEESSDDGILEIEGDRIMFVFHVIVRRDTNSGPATTSVSISELEVHRHSDDMLIGDGDDDESEARDDGESEARDGGESEVRGDVSEA